MTRQKAGEECTTMKQAVRNDAYTKAIKHKKVKTTTGRSTGRHL